MKSRAKFKYNSGNGALLCSKCFTIIKTGIEYTYNEKLAERGELHLDPQYCNECKKKNYEKEIKRINNKL